MDKEAQKFGSGIGIGSGGGDRSEWKWTASGWHWTADGWERLDVPKDMDEEVSIELEVLHSLWFGLKYTYISRVS
jgi:hypothetical protein